MFITKLDLEQIRNSTEFIDQYTASESQALAESGADLQSLVNHMLSATKRILSGDTSGIGDWRDSPAASLLELSSASGFLNSQIDQINVFIGRNSGELNPVYSSTFFITQSGSLEQAIGELDAQLASVGSSGTWQQHFDNGNGTLVVDGTPDASIQFIGDGKWTFGQPGSDTVFSSSGVLIRALGHRVRTVLPSNLAAGSTVSIPNSLSYTPDLQSRNLYVYVNGNLLMPGSGITSNNEDFRDYRELSSTSIVINEKWKSGWVVQYVIKG